MHLIWYNKSESSTQSKKSPHWAFCFPYTHCTVDGVARQKKERPMSLIQPVILAAGKGSRMKSTDTNKCLLPLAGKPMLRYELEALQAISTIKPIVVVGFARESIMRELGNAVTYAIQEEANGTAKALEAALPHIDPTCDQVIVLYGDHSAFYDKNVLAGLVAAHSEKQADMTLMTVRLQDPTGYGRILRDASGKFIEIVEEKNATEAQRAIQEINSGNGMYNAAFLQKVLPTIQMNDLTKEYYLTDLVKLGMAQGYSIEALVSDDEALSAGVNTPEQYAYAELLMKNKLGIA